jgi:hypothetical protein
MNDETLHERLTAYLADCTQTKAALQERAQTYERQAAQHASLTLSGSYARQAFWAHAQANAYRDVITNLERLLGA